MSRGIGRLQQDILIRIGNAGKPMLARVIADSLWRVRGRAGCATRAFQVSVRRALHGLAKRCLIKISRPPDDRDAIFYGLRGHDTLVAWMPDRKGPPWLYDRRADEPPPPERKNFSRNVPGKSYENAVLDILQRLGPEVEYRRLIDAVVAPFWPDVGHRYMALRRAVERLERRNVIGTFRRLRRGPHGGTIILRVWLIGS